MMSGLRCHPVEIIESIRLTKFCLTSCETNGKDMVEVSAEDTESLDGQTVAMKIKFKPKIFVQFCKMKYAQVE